MRKYKEVCPKTIDVKFKKFNEKIDALKGEKCYTAFRHYADIAIYNYYRWGYSADDARKFVHLIENSSEEEIRNLAKEGLLAIKNKK